MCLPVYQWCPALQMSLFTCLPSVVSQCARGDRLCGCLSELVCLAVSGSPDVYTCLPSFFAGCLSFLVSLHVTPSVLVVPGSLGVSPNLCAEWCPALRVSLFTCLPSCLPRCLVVSGSLDVFCVFSLVSHHVSLAMCLPIYPSANFIFCLQSSVCLYGGVRLFRLFAFVCVFHHLSLTFCLVLHLSPKPLVSNHMSALVVVSCSSFVMFLFVFRACLWSLLPLCLLVVKIKIMFHHGFMRFTTYLPLVSYLVSHSLSQVQMP